MKQPVALILKAAHDGDGKQLGHSTTRHVLSGFFSGHNSACSIDCAAVTRRVV